MSRRPQQPLPTTAGGAREGSRGLLAAGLAATLAAAVALVQSAAPAAAAPPRVHALTGARVVVSPGVVLERATVVVRDGLIEAVGVDVEPPADARLWELDELTIYPGLIEPYSTRAWPAEDPDAETPQAGHANPLVRPEREMMRHAADAGLDEKLRGAGFTIAGVAARDGLFRGRGTVLHLGEGETSQRILRPRWGHHVTIRPRAEGGYPNSLMGAVALFRQTLIDAAWNREAWPVFRGNPAQERPPFNTAHEALSEAVAGFEPMVFETRDVVGTLRIIELVDEFGLDAVLVGNGEEHRWLDQVAAAGLPHLVPLDFPDAPANLPEAAGDDDMTVGLETLREWDDAPSNPGRLLAAGIEVAFTTHGLDDPKKLFVALGRSLERDLAPEAALAALTTTPAALLGIGEQAGTLAAGKMANLVVVDGELLIDKPKIREVWVDGERYEVKESKPAEVEPAGTWEIVVRTPDGTEIAATLELSGTAEALDGDIGVGELKIPIDSAEVSGKDVEITFDGTRIGESGPITFKVTIEGDRATGTGRSPSGPFSISATRIRKPGPEAMR